MNPMPIPARVPIAVWLKYMPIAIPRNINPINTQLAACEKRFDFMMCYF